VPAGFATGDLSDFRPGTEPHDAHDVDNSDQDPIPSGIFRHAYLAIPRINHRNKHFAPHAAHQCWDISVHMVEVRHAQEGFAGEEF